jgi:hypothetical protein
MDSDKKDRIAFLFFGALVTIGFEVVFIACYFPEILDKVILNCLGVK